MFQVLFIALWLWFNGRTVILLWSIVTVKSVYNNIHFFLHEWYLQPFPFDIPLCLISFYCFLWSQIAVFGSKWIFVYILELPILFSKALLFLYYIQVKWFRFFEKNWTVSYISLFYFKQDMSLISGCIMYLDTEFIFSKIMQSYFRKPILTIWSFI